MKILVHIQVSATYDIPTYFQSISNTIFFLLLSDPLLPVDPQERFKKGGNISLGAIRPTHVKLMGVCSPTSSHSQTLNINLTLLENALFIL